MFDLAKCLVEEKRESRAPRQGKWALGVRGVWNRDQRGGKKKNGNRAVLGGGEPSAACAMAVKRAGGGRRTNQRGECGTGRRGVFESEQKGFSEQSRAAQMSVTCKGGLNVWGA
eukprot:365251-Chlamydomonas_euryale.AAC.8